MRRNRATKKVLKVTKGDSNPLRVLEATGAKCKGHEDKSDYETDAALLC